MDDPANGTLTINPDGGVTYTPNANWSGSDSFIYQVCDSSDPALGDTATVTITVSPVNDAPVANDHPAPTQEDQAVVIEVLPNDTDADGDLLFISSYSPPANGSVVLNADGTFTYTPNVNWYGTDTFTYSVCDPSGACDEALVTVEVLPVNDPPVAMNDAAATAEESPVTINVAGNDYDVDGNLVPTSASPISVMITIGEAGVAIADKDGCIQIRPPAVNVVGTSGAGDAFCAALAVGLANGQLLRDSVNWACQAAALSVTRPGTILAYPTLTEVEEFNRTCEG